MNEELEKLETTDKKIKFILKKINHLLEEEELRPDKNDDFFSGRQLADLREILEKKGFSITANVFLKGRIEKVGNKWESKKNKVLFHAVKLLEGSGLDIATSAYFLGKLNQILSQFREEEEDQ